MATATNKQAGQLKQDIQSKNIRKLYFIYGDEAYLKEYYRDALMNAVLDETFREFNLQVFDGKSLSPEQLTNAIESYPAMAERRVVVVKDLDPYKPPAAFQPVLTDILCDLPDYVCLIFYFDIVEFKPDKRMKLHGILEKSACFAEFSHLEGRELIDWIRRHVNALHKKIDDETCEHLLFLCGNSMTNLLTEIEKVCAFSTLDHITTYHIDQVCTRVLDAVIFDLTDAIANGQFEHAISIFQELIAQKNDEIQIFSSILRHMQRLYASKLVEQSRAGEKLLMDLVGSRSPYYVRKLATSARRLSLPWLRRTTLLCAETDASLKSSVSDRQKQVELTLLQMAAYFKEKT